MDTTKQNKLIENKTVGKTVVFKFDSDEDSCSNANPLKSTFEIGSASKDNLPYNEVVIERVLEGAINSEQISIDKDNLHREYGLDSMQVVHKNDLFKGESHENDEDTVDIGNDYRARDVSLRKEPPLASDHNIVSSTEMAYQKDDQRMELQSDLKHSISDQVSVDMRDLSPSKVFKELVWQEVTHKKKKKTEVAVSRPITRASKQSSQ